MIRRSIAISALAALAACGQPADKAEAPPAASGAGGFPLATASYTATYAMNGEGAAPDSATAEVASWRKMRMTMPHPSASRAKAGQSVVMVRDEANERWMMYVEGPNAPKIAQVMPTDMDWFRSFEAAAPDGSAPPTKVGEDTVAGLKCDVWETAATADTPAHHACVTSDGILLRTGRAGAEPDMIATTVKKGQIDAARFAIPAGFEVVDMSPCMDLMSQAMDALKSGKQPDMAKMQACEEIGGKVAAMMGE